jgi:hypothetical protein
MHPFSPADSNKQQPGMEQGGKHQTAAGKLTINDSLPGFGPHPMAVFGRRTKSGHHQPAEWQSLSWGHPWIIL